MAFSVLPGSSSDVFAWISRFINLERGQSSRSFRLDRMLILAELADHPERCAPAIHVAGSKGKGSVTGMISVMLEAAGIPAARYTSPDMGDRRERISRGRRFFDEAVYVEAGKELIRAVEALQEKGENLFDPQNAEGEEPTFFELMTLLFFLCARRARSKALAVETGMGGRLDATNIIDPLVSVITLIELEHTEYLGNTLGKIAGEKAGIIKRGKPLILAEQDPEALEVFRTEAARLGAPLRYLPGLGLIENICIRREGTSFTLDFPGAGILPRPFPLFVPIPGEIQARNAALAVLALKTAFPGLEDAALVRGLKTFRLPGRFEKILRRPEFIIDGAHTAKSVSLCADTFGRLYGETGILIFGCADGKDVSAMAEILGPRFSRIIITTPGTFKKSSPAEVHAVFERYRSGELLLIPDTAEAIRKALELGAERESPVLGTGSFYLAAAIRDYVLSRQGRH